MKTILALLSLIALTLPSLRAEDAPATTPEAPLIELKKKSTFNMDASGRNPFWPIGWKPVVRTSTTTTEHTGPDILPTAFVVTSITLDQGARYAIINGKVMAEGQQFGLQLGNQTYQLTVKAIEDGRVILARRDQEIIVPLRRK
jgi:hypothetical protein